VKVRDRGVAVFDAVRARARSEGSATGSMTGEPRVPADDSNGKEESMAPGAKKEAKKETKKKPTKTIKEKRAEKKAKKESKG